MHWTERRRAKAKLGIGLRAAGWQLHGFKEDKSDSMSDYYEPESWAGLAEKDGPGGLYVVVVDVKPSNETILKRSGGYKTTKRVPGDKCPHCNGTGQEPAGWTYEQARAKPREFNLDRTKRQTPGAVPLMPHVVSPLYFGEGGREKCVKCGGLGHTWRLEEVSVDWPKHRANPERKLWHVEKDGRILDSGIGMGPCADYDQERAQAAVERIVARIENAVQGRPSIAPTSAVTEVTVRRNLAKNGIEVVFPAKPGADVRAALQRIRFRWSRRQGLWYARYGLELWEEVHSLLDVVENSPDEEDETSTPQPKAAVAESTPPLPESEPCPTAAVPPARAGPSQPAQSALI